MRVNVVLFTYCDEDNSDVVGSESAHSIVGEFVANYFLSLLEADILRRAWRPRLLQQENE